MSKQATGNRVGEWLTVPRSKGGQSSSEALQLRGSCHFHLTCSPLTCDMFAHALNTSMASFLRLNNTGVAHVHLIYNTWWSYENFVVLLHFSLEYAAFHTESREIAIGCTETHCMKKEDEQFGHSTSLVFYLQWFLASLRVLFRIWRPGGYKYMLGTIEFEGVRW